MRSPETVSIGEAAELVGTTTRTLRYYEELGLVSSTRPSTTGQRRYGPAEIARLRRIRELQTLLGLELDEIAEQLGVSDRLDGLKAEYHSGPPAERREAILDESFEILRSLRRRVVERQEAMVEFLSDLDERLERVEDARKLAPARTPPARTPLARTPPAKTPPARTPPAGTTPGSRTRTLRV